MLNAKFFFVAKLLKVLKSDFKQQKGFNCYHHPDGKANVSRLTRFRLSFPCVK